MFDDRSAFRHALAGMVAGALLMAAFPAVAASVGDALKLGRVNKIDARTTLKGDPKGAVLQVQSTGKASAILVEADRNALKVKVDAGKSPITVNGSAGTAKNLSADELDGMDSSAFLGVGGTAADSDRFDGFDSSELVPASSCDPGRSFVGFDRGGVVCRIPTFELLTVDNPPSVGEYTSLVLDAAGNPVIGYYDATNTALKVAHCNDPACSGGDESLQTVDDTASVGLYTSVVLDAAGNPVIGYYDFTNTALKVASV